MKRKLYMMLMLNHSNFSISSSGIWLHPKHPYIGASPDAIFTCQCHEIKRLIVKCPYSKRYTLAAKEAANDKSFCLDCELNLKQGHKYYTQIQIQLFVFDCKNVNLLFGLHSGCIEKLCHIMRMY